MFDTAFGAYINHQTELDNIVNKIAAAAYRGDTSISLETNEDLAQSDYDYIYKQLKKRGVNLN